MKLSPFNINIMIRTLCCPYGFWNRGHLLIVAIRIVLPIAELKPIDADVEIYAYTELLLLSTEP